MSVFSADLKNRVNDSDNCTSGTDSTIGVDAQTQIPDELSGKQTVKFILDTISDPAALLSAEWELIYANKALLGFGASQSEENQPKGRPGDILGCVRAIENSKGCGNSDYCRFCGIYNAILECQRTGKQIIKESRITSRHRNETRSHDFLISVNLYNYCSHRKFYLFSARDISDRKRRNILEKMLFHSVHTTVSDLSDILHVFKGTEENACVNESGEFAGKAANGLLSDIQFLKTLDAVEKGTFKPMIAGYDVNLVMQEVADFLRFTRYAEGKSIVIEPFTGTSEPFADVGLLRWALVNLVKNGLEASFRSDTVNMQAIESEGYITFRISNPGIIPEAVGFQIFQRSFSTKATDRGLGTYSAKLFANSFLGGEVYFESGEQQGTIFSIILPVDQGAQFLI